jgi:hypothetical protein
MRWKLVAGGVAALVVIVGIVVAGSGAGPRHTAKTGATTATTTTTAEGPTAGGRVHGSGSVSTTSSPATKASGARDTGAAPRPGWFCSDAGAPSPHYGTSAAGREHACSDSELAADPPDWSQADPASAVTQSYWSCWDSGAPEPHHLGHTAPHEHLCTNGELAGAGS